MGVTNRADDAQVDGRRRPNPLIVGVPGRITTDEEADFRLALRRRGMKRSHAIRRAIVLWTDRILGAPEVGEPDPRTRLSGELARPKVVAGWVTEDEYARFYRACARAGLEQSRAVQLALVTWIRGVLREA